MSSLCLDTSAYSNFRRGNEEVAALLDTLVRVLAGGLASALPAGLRPI